MSGYQNLFEILPEISSDETDARLHLLASVAENANDAIVITEAELITQPGPRIIYANPAFFRLSGYKPEEAIGNTPRILQGPKTDRAELDKIRKALENWQSIRVELINYRKDGSQYWVELDLAPVADKQGCHTHWISIQRDITKRKLIEEEQQKAEEIARRKLIEKQLRHNSFRDSLTDLPNRLLFASRLERALARLEKHRGELVTVLFLDLDDFKMVNDSLGHDCGDQLLIEIARRLRKCLRPKDTIARLGGDEFAILLEKRKKTSEAIEIAASIQKEVNLPFYSGRQEIFTSASIGIALCRSGECDSPENLIRNANLAMHHAKKEGRSNHAIFDAAMHDRAVKRLELETALKRALEREEFFLHYQPIVSLDTGEIEGFEALVRWHHPDRGAISPMDFIPVAEATGLIVPLDRWVLQRACRQLRLWHDMFPNRSKLTISVNLSSKQFTQPNLVEQVARILESTELEAKCLRLEITESLLMENLESANDTLLQLNKLGVQIHLDDFGTGFSSLSRLHRLPIKTLKIDRSFVTDMHVDLDQLEIVRTILLMAHNLGLQVIAEGVEKSEHRQQLQSLNCGYAQGYLFSRPVNEEAATTMLASKE